MTNNNKKPTTNWARKLYERVDTALKASKGKTYFAHRYPVNTTEDESPFSGFFSDFSSQHQPINSTKHLRARNNPTSDTAIATGDNAQNLTDDIKLQTANNAIGLQSVDVVVIGLYDETQDCKTFRLRRVDGKIFAYLPGQYVTLSVVIAGQTYKRSYSIATSPNHSDMIEITVKRHPNGGIVSNWLNNHIKGGDRLTLKGPYGNFTCAKAVPAKILMLAAGSGIVPIMSMLRWLAQTSADTDVILLLSFRHSDDIIYRDELALLANRYSIIKLIITLTKMPLENRSWQGKSGRITRAMLASCVPDVSERTAYLCGPETFMADCKQSLQALKLPPSQLHCESFTVNASTPVLAQPSVDTNSLNSKAGKSLTIKRPTGNYQIRFAKSGQTLVADGTLTLLDLAEQSGVRISNDCRAGNCGECMVKCLQGKVDMTAQAEIDERDRKQGWVYTCCAYPASNAVLDA